MFLNNLLLGNNILTDVTHFNFNMTEYYFPGVDYSKTLINPYILPKIDKTRDNYLFIYEWMDEGIIKGLNDQGLSYEVVMENARIDYYRFNVYKLVNID